MRLTLRTLLASLDHVLPAGEQHELDTKISASPAASQLAARILRVREQATIPAPRLDGVGLAADANSVAEYLDNCLDPDRLETFERICIESDMHLAEVSACHAILAHLAANPTVADPLDAAGRRRLLEAMGHHSADVHAPNRQEAVANARALLAAASATRTVPRTDTGFRRRASWVAWVSAIAAIALVAALAALLFEAITRRRGAHTEHAAARELAADAPEAAAVVHHDVEVVAPEPPSQEAADTPAARPGAVREETVAPGMAEVAGTPQPAPEAPGEQEADGSAIAGSAALAESPAPNAVGGTDGGGREQESLGFAGADGLLLRRRRDDGLPPWSAIEPGAALGAREELLIPAGFQPGVTIRGVTIRFLAGTRALITADPDGSPRLEVVFGRAIAHAGGSDARLGVSAGGLVGTITAGLAGQAAIEVVLDHAAGVDPAAAPARVRARIAAVNGSLGWRQGSRVDGPSVVLDGIAPEGVIEARSAIAWDGERSRVARVVRLDPLPEWIVHPLPTDRLQRNACEALLARISGQPDIGGTLREIAAESKVENEMLAATTLALLGDFEAAVGLLCTEAQGRSLEHRRWLMLEADVVPLALARGANAAAKLRRAFGDHAPHGKAETLYRMALGYSDDDLVGGADEMLVAALDDESLVVRRYAYKNLCDIVQPSRVDQLHYRPDGQADRRHDGVNWWRGQLQKGLIRRGRAA